MLVLLQISPQMQQHPPQGTDDTPSLSFEIGLGSQEQRILLGMLSSQLSTVASNTLLLFRSYKLRDEIRAALKKGPGACIQDASLDAIEVGSPGNACLQHRLLGVLITHTSQLQLPNIASMEPLFQACRVQPGPDSAGA
jgi:hypothetical protein